MPIWICEKNDEHKVVFGAIKDLEEKSGQKITDLHKHTMDEVTFSCEECDGEMKRIPDVIDTWFDSGSMPYAQAHYPFENKEKFEASFPAEFIAEGQDQTRAWFYYLHVLATSIKKTPAFKNVIVNGIVLAEDGKKMAKKLKNYPDPNLILEKYGADALRYYMTSSPVLQAESMNFSEEGVREVFNKVVNTSWNVLEFYGQFAGVTPSSPPPNRGRKSAGSGNVLDKWILCKIHVLLGDVTEKMNAYDLPGASRPIKEFVEDLSTWYVRRSRDRFKGADETDRAAAMATLGEVLSVLSKVIAPFMPFLAEKIWQRVNSEQGIVNSVHLQTWPEVNESMVDDDLMTAMSWVRNFATIGHGLRKKEGVNVRQPLASFVVGQDASPPKYWEECKYLLEDELNVKEIVFDKGQALGEDHFDFDITPELKKEGLAREVIRAINQMRKEQKLTREDEAVVEYSTDDEMLNNVFEEFADEIKRQTRTKDFAAGGGDEIDFGGIKLKIGLR